jgi:hypothetical protein
MVGVAKVSLKDEWFCVVETQPNDGILAVGSRQQRMQSLT